jgi:hypothetical protein
VDPIQIESPTAQINRARYAGKDFFTFIDDIVARIQLLFVTEFNDFVVSGTGQMLIDIVAWAAETLSFYIDRQAAESYLSTARTKKAASRIARATGYKMHGAISSSTDLEVNLRSTYAFDVPIAIGQQFKGPNGLIFEAVEAITFPTGEGPASPARTVSVREGTTKVEVFTSNGAKNQIFRLNPGTGKTVAEGTVIVLVGGFPWSVDDLITFDQTNQVEVDFGTEPASVRFGDGVAGNIPPTGAEIRVTYLSTSGRAGLVMSDTINDVAQDLVVMFENIPLTVTNPQPSGGGDDPEDLASVKAKAPRYFRARNVAVTQQDYVGLSEAYTDPVAGAVSVAQAFVARSAAEDIELQTLLGNIRSIVAPISTDIQALVVAGKTNIATAETLRAQTETLSITDVQGHLDAIVSDPLLPTASGPAIEARTKAQSVRIASNDASVRADEGLAAGSLALKDAALSDIKASLSSVESLVQDIVAASGSVERSVAAAASNVADAATGFLNMEALLVLSDTAFDDITTRITSNFENSIEDQLDAIYNHVDGFLSADCKSNLVQVPILTRDVDGFLTDPPIALLRSLEAYLRARCEVTQTVEAVSGVQWLVRAVIEGKVGILSGFVQATVLSNVRKAIDDLLRVRPFGKSLRLSDLYGVVVGNPVTGQRGVDGVGYAVFRIVGPVDLVDLDGNLVIPTKMVVTKGTVTVTAEAAVA